MIEIKLVRASEIAGRKRLSADIVVDGVSRELWFEVEEEYGKYLCDERSDAFVVGLLSLAIREKHDIEFVAPMTAQLKDQLEHDFLDVVCQHQPGLHKVKLLGPVAEPIYKNREIMGTGVSCGVDSLFTIKRRFIDSQSEKYLFLTNQSPVNGARVVFECLKKNAMSFAADAGVNLIIGDTNYCGGIPGLTTEGATTYCNLFSVLALQKLFSRYFIASGGPICDFSKYIENGMFGTDCSNYDLLLLSACSTMSCKFIVDGLEDRIKKVQDLVSWPLAWNHLDVCFRHADPNGMNGTNDCPKCVHTIVEILVAGGMDALEKFNAVFNVDYVRQHKHEYLADLIRIRLQRTEYGLELWPLRSRAGFTAWDYIKAIPIVFSKAVKKILRGGKTQIGAFSSKG